MRTWWSRYWNLPVGAGCWVAGAWVALFGPMTVGMFLLGMTLLGASGIIVGLWIAMRIVERERRAR